MSVEPVQGSVINRRVFARNTVASGIVALASTAPSQESKRPRPDGLSISDWEEVQSRWANLLRVYGKRLSAHEKERVLEILTTNQHMLSSIRSFMVQNSDAAALTLRLVP